MYYYISVSFISKKSYPSYFVVDSESLSVDSDLLENSYRLNDYLKEYFNLDNDDEIIDLEITYLGVEDYDL